VVEIRPLRLQDADAFRAFVERLSPASRYERFQYVVKEVSPELLRLLVEADPRSHVALAAFEGDAVVGEARYVRAGGGAEFALAVADAWRRRGVGKRLLGELLAYAHRDGVTRLDGRRAGASGGERVDSGRLRPARRGPPRAVRVTDQPESSE
jgi:acetyltransferase